MSINIVVPTLGESVTEATVAKWMKAAGDPVEARRGAAGAGDRQGHAGGLCQQCGQARGDQGTGGNDGGSGRGAGRDRRGGCRPLRRPRLPACRRRGAEAGRSTGGNLIQRQGAPGANPADAGPSDTCALGAQNRRRSQSRCERCCRQRQGRPVDQGRCPGAGRDRARDPQGSVFSRSSTRGTGSATCSTPGTA